MMVVTSYCLVLSAALFTIGVLGVLLRRNVIVAFMSIEVMLNAANLAFIALGRALSSITGQVFVFFIIAVAAAEAAVGLAIIVAIFHRRETIDVDDISLMKW
jgi:NADH-quinone oxidoreductase subunit K